MAEKDNKKKQVPLRLSAKLYDAIAAWAEDDFRSVNGQIEYLLTECVRHNAIKLGVRGFVRICIETCARGCFGAWKYRFRKKGMLIRQMLFICQK